MENLPKKKFIDQSNWFFVPVILFSTTFFFVEFFVVFKFLWLGSFCLEEDESWAIRCDKIEIDKYRTKLSEIWANFNLDNGTILKGLRFKLHQTPMDHQKKIRLNWKQISPIMEILRCDFNKQIHTRNQF